MKPITLHPVSVLVGLVLAGLLAVLAGAAQAPGGVQSIPTRDARVLGQIPAEDWVFARVRIYRDDTGTTIYNDTYTVPPDRYFVVTAARSKYSYDQLLVNGVPYTDSVDGLFACLVPQNLGSAELSIDNHATRLVFQPGTTLSFPAPPASSGYGVHLWGYLEPVR